MIDITHIKRQTVAIEHQNRILREIARMQSHEVRAPLARIMGLVSLLGDEACIPDNVRHILDNILTSANELDATIRKIVRHTEKIENELRR